VILPAMPKQNKISPKHIINLQTLEQLAEYSPQDISSTLAKVLLTNTTMMKMDINKIFSTSLHEF
jgi:hypothetical protein